MNVDVLTLFPSWFGWFGEQRHVRNAAELGHRLEAVDLRASTPLKSGQVDDTHIGPVQTQFGSQAKPAGQRARAVGEFRVKGDGKRA